MSRRMRFEDSVLNLFQGHDQFQECGVKGKILIVRGCRVDCLGKTIRQ